MINLRIFIPTIILIILTNLSPNIEAAPTAPTQSSPIQPTLTQIAKTFNYQPLMFIEEQPQHYHLRGSGLSLWFMPEAIWLRVEKQVSNDVKNENKAQNSTTTQTIKLTFLNANADVVLEPLTRQTVKISYFLGNTPEDWRSEVPVYEGVRYRNLYDGLDLLVSGSHGQLTWQWEQSDNAPNTQTVAIRLDNGQTTRTLTWKSMAHELNNINDNSPFTEILPLLASPQANNVSDLLWSTFLGGSNRDMGTAIDVDKDGNIYIIGRVYSSNFPTTIGAYDTSHNGGYNDIFVVKLNPDGTFNYGTFLGGSDWDDGWGITVDKKGQVYFTGKTLSKDFPTTVKTYDNSYNGGGEFGGDAFVVKLNNTGSKLEYASFLGGSDLDFGWATDVSSSGDIYVVGDTWSTDFPTTVGAYDTSFNGGAGDTFIVRINTINNKLSYATFLGGSDDDNVKDIVIDSDGNAYLTGSTSSANFPTTIGAYSNTYSGRSKDAFVAKLNSTGSNLSYATFLGGNDKDNAKSIAIDQIGNAYIVGDTESSNFPVTANAYDTSLNEQDVFVVKLNSTGSNLSYATFLGGSSKDYGTAIALDRGNNAYLTGGTWSSNFPTTTDAYDAFFNKGYSDAFIAKLNSTGSNLSYATFLGGSNRDEGVSIVVDKNGNTYSTGETWSSNFPISVDAYDRSFNGGYTDAFVTKLSIVLQSAVTLNKTSIDFSNQAVGHTSLTKTLILTNTDGADLTINSISVTKNFSQTNNCTSTILPTANCTINITFTPTAERLFTGTLTIKTNAPSSPDIVNLRGKGIEFQADEDGVNFGDFGYHKTDNPDAFSWKLFQKAFPKTNMELADGNHRHTAEMYYQNTFANAGRTSNAAGFSAVSLVRYLGLTETVETELLSVKNQAVTQSNKFGPPPKLIPASDGYNYVQANSSDIADYLHLYHTRQMSYQFGLWHREHQIDTPSQTFSTTHASADPLAVSIQVIKDDGRFAGHRLVAYRTEKIGHMGYIYVYDSNYPNDNNRRIEINLREDSWQYDISDDKQWRRTGSGLFYSLPALNFPAQAYDGRESGTLVKAASRQKPSNIMLHIKGQAQLLLKNTAGQQLGYNNGSWVQTMPSGTLMVEEGFNPQLSAADSGVSYFVPASATYTVQIRPLTQTGRYTLTAFGYDSAIQLTDVDIVSNTVDTLIINQTILSTTFIPASDGVYCHQLTHENLTESRKFVSCVDGETSSRLRFTFNPIDNRLTLTNMDSSQSISISLTNTISRNGQPKAEVVKLTAQVIKTGEQVTLPVKLQPIYLPIIAKE